MSAARRTIEQVTNHPRVGRVGDYCGWAFPANRPHFLAQRVVRASRERYACLRIAARPRLDAGVDVQSIEFAAQADDRYRGHLDGKVNEEPARDQRG